MTHLRALGFNHTDRSPEKVEVRAGWLAVANLSLEVLVFRWQVNAKFCTQGEHVSKVLVFQLVAGVEFHHPFG